MALRIRETDPRRFLAAERRRFNDLPPRRLRRRPLVRARAAERRVPLVEPERSLPSRRTLLIVWPGPRPRCCFCGEPGRPPPPPASADFFGFRLSVPCDLTRASAPAQQSAAAALVAAGASPSPASASPAAPAMVFIPPRPRPAGVDSVSSAPSTASPVSASLSFPPWNFPCHQLMLVRADSVLTVTLGSAPSDSF